MNSEHEQNSRKLANGIWFARWRQTLLADGRSDAFAFALECHGDVEQVTKQVLKIEELMSDSDSPKGLMPSGSSSRIYREDYLAGPGTGALIYREGYLAGLKEAVRVITEKIVEEKQAV